jgi:branched-chain amino acid transport system substrate-binding protein
VLSLTGPGAFLGKEEGAAFEALEKTVNADGGVRGTPVHFAILDDQTNPQVAIQLTTQIKAQKAAVLFGSSLVAPCNAMAPLLRAGPVQYCLSPSFHPDTAGFSYSYSAGAASDDIFAVELRYLRLNHARRIAVVSANDATGQDADRAIGALFANPENRELVFVGTEHFAPGDISMAAQMSHLKAEQPDAIIVTPSGTGLGTVLRAMNDAGINIPTVTSMGNMTFATMDQYASLLPKTFLFPAFRFFDTDIGPGPLRDAIAKMRKALADSGIKPDAQPGFVWDPGMLVIAALRQYGLGASAGQIRSYIDSQRSFVGVNGLYNFPGIPQRGINDKSLVMTRWDPAKGSWVAVSGPAGVPR